ncbi:TerB N-terminal domain-containing protein [Aquimonas sp.]|jgi:uncharacterized tellurite resistance protein B-like protein|uniref:tellurite resistance TerB family protein n=1 Tax=Aquimonas sp. TaxID=1872588 RepID=UPI0037C184AE
MAKGGGNFGIGALIVVLAILVWIPKEVWIAVLVLGAIGLGIYFIQKKNAGAPKAKRGQTHSGGSDNTLAQLMADQKRFSDSVGGVAPKNKPTEASRTSATDSSQPELVTTMTPSGGRKVTLTIDLNEIVTRALDRSREGEPTPSGDDGFDGEGSEFDSRAHLTEANRDAGLKWMPFDTPVQTDRFSIGRGGFYVCHQNVGFDAAVDVRLPISKRSPDWAGQGIYYYPRYTQLSPQQREAFLGFLNGTRREGHLNPGYVWLYIYNLERRALVDPPDAISQSERAWLLFELEELFETYGAGGDEHAYQALSYGRYLPTLISVARVRLLGRPAYIAPPWPPGRHLETGPVLLGLGRATMETHLAAEWAYQWAYASHPPVSYAPWKVVEDELRTLFVRRYRERHAEGIVLKQPVSARALKLEHQFAYDGGQSCRVDALVPDVSKLTRPVKPLLDLLHEVMAELEPLRKARRSSTATREMVLAAYPPSLVEAELPEQLGEALSKLEISFEGRTIAHVPTEEVYKALGLTLPNGPDKRAAARLGHILGLVRVGMEPDPRYEGPTPGSHVVLFKLQSMGSSGPTPRYGFALLLAQTGRHLAEASEGGSIAERDTLFNLVRTRFDLTPDEAARLEAHIAFVDTHAPKLAKLDSRIRALPEAERHALARALLEIAAADGRVDPAEVRALEKLYKSLQIPADSLHADLHAVLSGASPDRSRMLPATPGQLSGIRISEESLARKLEETVRVQAMLHEIFAEEESAPAASPDMSSVTLPEPSSLPTLEGLASVAAGALQALLATQRNQWDRATWDLLCEQHGVLPEGTLEAINEWAFERAGEALLEGDDPLELNEFARDELGLQEH